MERKFIERSDFPAVGRGYDPAEVDRHLRAVADEMERVRSSGAGGAAADQVRGIAEAAERAAEMQYRAEEEATRMTSDASEHAREVGERANADTAAHIERVEQATQTILDRANSADGDLDHLLNNARTTAESLLASLRGELESIMSELERIRAELTALRGPDAPGSGPEADAEGAAPRLAEDGSSAQEQEESPTPARAATPPSAPGSEGARMIALNMALNGKPRGETARYLSENFDLDDKEAVLDDVYSRVGG